MNKPTPIGRAVLRTLAALTDPTVRRATTYLSTTSTVKITRTEQHTRKNSRRGETFVLTYGKPNYVERQFIKAAVRAGEPFPVKKPLLQLWPK